MDEAASTSAHAMPSIHVELLEESLVEGRNTRREAYVGLLAACQAAGFPTTPLSEQDAGKLGTSRVRLWFSEGLQVLSREAWDFEKDDTPAQACHFRLVRTGLHSRTDVEGAAETDLRTGEVTRSPSEAASLERLPVHDTDVMSALGFSGPHNQSVAGQPCSGWTSPDGGTVCLWSGGREWGFSDRTNAAGCAPAPLSTFAAAIVLAQTPSNAGHGCRVTTVRFETGAPLDKADMAPPGPAHGTAP